MKLIVTLFFCSLPLLTCGQIKFQLTAETTPKYNNKKVFLLIQDISTSNRYKVRDSAIIKNNSFSFAGTIQKPCETAEIYFKRPEDGRGQFSFVIDSGINRMVLNETTNDQQIANQLAKTTVLNSKSNLLFRKLHSLEIEFYKESGEKINGSSSAKYLTNEVRRNLFVKNLEIIRAYPDNYYSLLKLYEMTNFAGMGPLIDTILSEFRNLDPSLRLSPLGREFYARRSADLLAFKGAKSGQPVPQFSVQKFDKSTLSNKDLLGTPYIIAFSATWCIPCKVYEKKLRSILKKYRPDGLQVVYFNLDDGYAEWKAATGFGQPGWIDVSEQTKFIQSKIAKQFFVQGIPLYILVDKKGLIAYNRDEIADTDYQFLEKYVDRIVRE
jgi:thiol-disulfide isomerase/thioredoxin